MREETPPARPNILSLLVKSCGTLLNTEEFSQLTARLTHVTCKIRYMWVVIVVLLALILLVNLVALFRRK
jgi:hypothetical protein